MSIYILCQVVISSTRPKENAPHEAGHYLILVARGGIEPPTQGFSTPLLGSTSIIYSFLVGFKLGKFTGVATDVYQSI